MEKLYTAGIYLFGTLFIVALVFWVSIRFMNPTLTETQLFLKFWYMIPVMLLLGLLTAFCKIKKENG
jgi:hypothetical protein